MQFFQFLHKKRGKPVVCSVKLHKFRKFYQRAKKHFTLQEKSIYNTIKQCKPEYVDGDRKI